MTMNDKTDKRMRLKHIFSFFFVNFMFLAVFAGKANAAGFWTTPAKPQNVPTDFDTAILNMTNWILGFVGSIAVLAIIWGGVLYLTSVGDENQLESGTKTIKNGVLGLVIAGIAYAVVQVIVDVIL